MSKLIYAVVYNNGQVDAWSTNQGPPAMPYVPECEITSEIDRLNEEVKELKKSWYEMHSSFEAERTVSDRYRMALEEIVARGTDYDSTMNELVYIAREAVGEVQGE